MYRCPNPKCQREIENFIIVHDHSKKPADIYYGCPYCLFKLDPTATQVLKKEEMVVEEKKDTKKILPKREVPPGCPQYLGYLSIHFNEANIPQECLICPRILDCTK
ncbi:MAG: hypothetical protein NWE80_03440 [Candidatus Bathyarchaeota archaeon]|nr:hypothetical protein [Candidatus Bathyarchaeota archaeon]